MSTTGNAVAVREPAGALAIQDGQVEWDPMQLAALGQLGIAEAPDGDKQVFLHVSQRTGLDPFARQIYMIPRVEKKNERVNGQWIEKKTTRWTIQTGIEGWRVIRDRAERRNGVRGIKSRFTYYATDGSDHKVWVRRDPPVAIEMTYTVVEPSGREVPYTSVLRFDEYKQTKTYKQDGQDVTVTIAQWATKPVHMLEKCVEADAYRCAFPQDYSGVVLDDSMPFPDPDDETDAQPERQRVTASDLRERAAAARAAQAATAVVMSSREQFEEIKAHLDRLGIPAEQRGALISGLAGRDVPAPAELTADEAATVIRALEDTPTPEKTAEPAGEAPPPEPPPATEPQQGLDPRAAILAKFDALGITSHDDRNSYLTRLSGKPVASVDSISAAQAKWFAAKLRKITSRDELEAAAVAEEAKREQEASDGQ